MTAARHASPRWMRRQLDWIGERLNIQTQEDWYKVGQEEVKQCGGASLLRHYNHSFFNTALKEIYPEFDWDPKLRVEYLKSKTNRSNVLQEQREALDKFAEELNIEKQEEWYNVLHKASSMFKANKNKKTPSMFSLLQVVYPEFDWKGDKEAEQPSLSPAKIQWGRRKLDWIGKTLGVQTQEDWFDISVKEVERKGGIPLLEHFGRSLFRALQYLYPEFDWNPLDRLRVPSRHWKELKNQRDFMDLVAEKLQIKTQEDWFMLSYKALHKQGHSILHRYGQSWFSALKSVYPEFDWELSYQELLIKLKRERPPSILLARVWNQSIDPTGYWLSEKYDGCRAYWNGSKLISRLGVKLNPPASLPRDFSLDGELWCGRGNFKKTSSIVRMKDGADAAWKEVTYQVFDIPSLEESPVEERWQFLRDYFASNPSEHVQVVPAEKCQGVKHLEEKLKEVESGGGEGLVLRAPGSLYERKRSRSLLKVKSFMDAEAKVIGYLHANGKNAGEVGSLICQTKSGTTFHVGAGISNELRQNPPAIGTIITYRYHGLDNGIPKYATFLREAIQQTT